MAQFNKNTHQYLDQAKTLFEVVQIADQYGNMVGAANPSGMAVDAFGRARISQPITLFDSFNRYQQNSGFATSNTATASTTYDANSSTVLMTVDTTSGAKVVHETKRVFAYQPGKSLLIYNTFVMEEEKEGLRQRVGYFGANNGVFLEQSGNTVSFVIRSKSTGAIVEDAVTQENWNVDKLDETGPSLKSLDITKAQIFFTDIEWLGVGSVRCGFVIDGQLIHCHTFHHANLTDNTYMTTACLPIRYEIENIAETATSSTMRRICSSVISEGGYELRGRARSAGHAIASPYDLATAGTLYPAISIKLKSDRLDAIVIPKNFNLLGIGNSTRLQYKVVQDATVTGGSWTSAGADSAVEYNLTATSSSGGTVVTQGYIGITNQSSTSASLSGETFKLQLERNSFTSAASTFTVLVTGAANGDDVLAAIDWEEIT